MSNTTTNIESLKDDQFGARKVINAADLIQSLSEKKPASENVKIPSPAERKTFRMESSVLSRLQSFLPQLAASNSQLLQDDSMEDKPTGFQLEEINSDSDSESPEENLIEKETVAQPLEPAQEFKPYIEMDLNLGVFDVANDAKALDTLAAHCEAPKVDVSSTESQDVKPPTIEEL